MTRQQMAERLGVSAEQFVTVIENLAKDRLFRDSLNYYVNIYCATGRHLNEHGTRPEDPPDVEIRALRDCVYAGLQAGQTYRKPYAEALALVNERLAVFV